MLSSRASHIASIKKSIITLHCDITLIISGDIFTKDTKKNYLDSQADLKTKAFHLVDYQFIARHHPLLYMMTTKVRFLMCLISKDSRTE